MWTICFVINGETICIEIPILVPWDWNKFHRQWLSKRVLDPAVLKDLSILATINTLAAELSSATARKTLQAAAQNAVQQPTLKAAKINFTATKEE